MRTLGLLAIGLMLAGAAVDAPSATVTCVLDQQVNPTRQRYRATADNGNIQVIQNPVLSNVLLVSENCSASLGNGATCTFIIARDNPGPTSFQVEIGDNDPPVTCGPYTNADGLPVELVEFTVE